jgi:hypothetical protein
MDGTKLFQLLIKLALVESPNLHDGSEKHNRHLESMHRMANLYVEVGKAGRFISPEADPFVLAAIGFEESRHRTYTADGDCAYPMTGPKVCHSVGPMQVSTALPALFKADPSWANITAERLRDPETSVKAAYNLLVYWKSQCKGGPLATLGSWSAGKCVGKIAMGRRRCALAKALGDAAGVEVVGCDTPATDERTRRRVAALKRKDAKK